MDFLDVFIVENDAWNNNGQLKCLAIKKQMRKWHFFSKPNKQTNEQMKSTVNLISIYYK